MKFEDLCPQPGRFTLKSTGQTYTLRPISLADRAWINDKFGSDLQKIFSEMRGLEIAQIVYHQLDDASKESFQPREVILWDEETGQKVPQGTKGGPSLLAMMIEGLGELAQVFEALLKTIGISEPVINEMANQELKKKEMNRPPKPTGGGSSTSLPASMDTPLSRSAG